MSDIERIQNAIEYVAQVIDASQNTSGLRPLLKRLLEEEAELLGDDPVLRRAAEISARKRATESGAVVRLRRAA